MGVAVLAGGFGRAGIQGIGWVSFFGVGFGIRFGVCLGCLCLGLVLGLCCGSV